MPDGAVVMADINDPDQSYATGWQGSSLNPILEVKELEASITLGAYSEPDVTFGIDLDGVGKVEVVVGIKLPEISSTFSADYGKSFIRLLRISVHMVFSRGNIPPLDSQSQYPHQDFRGTTY